jgi:hypothetical protein
MPQFTGQLLAVNGPIVQVQIEVPLALAAFLQQNNEPIPSPVDGMALIDTGASITSIDESVFIKLGINPVGAAQVGTASGRHTQSTFPARVVFPGTNLPTLDAPRALGCNLSGQSVIDRPLIALIGRDLLSSCVLVYNGTLGLFSLSF